MQEEAESGRESRELSRVTIIATGQAFQLNVGSWANETFPESSPHSIARHLLEEADELRIECLAPVTSGDDIDIAKVKEEAADCLLLLLHLAHKLGFDLRDAASDKFDKNRVRKWETSAGSKGYWKHTREGV